MFSGKEIENIKGLSQEEVLERVRQYGYNEILSQEKRNVFLIFFSVKQINCFALLSLRIRHCGGLFVGR